MSEIQAVLFYKKYWNPTTARKKLKEMKLRAIKRVHKTDKYLRYRITEPKYKKMRIKKNPKKKIDFIIGFKK